MAHAIGEAAERSQVMEKNTRKQEVVGRCTAANCTLCSSPGQGNTHHI